MTPRWLTTQHRRWPAIVAVAAGSGLVAEAIGSANTPAVLFLNPLVLLLFGLLYGLPVLLVREAWARNRCGWLSLAVAGLAFTALDEGVVADVWFKAKALDFATDAAGRAGGVNWNLVCGLVVFHTFVSIGVSVVLAQLTFRSIAPRPWLRRRGIAVCIGLSLFVGVGAILPKDGKPVPDAPQRALALLLAVVLAGVAAALPAWRPRPRLRSGPPLSRRRLFGEGCALSVAFLLCFFGLPAMAPAVVPAAMAALYLTTLGVLWRRTTAADWTARHALAFTVGALAPSLVLGSLVHVLALQPLSAALFVWFVRRLDRRMLTEGEESAGQIGYREA